MKLPSEEIKLRAATTGDLNPLCGLLSRLFEQEADFTPDPAKQRRGLRLILEQPETGRIFCAEHPDAGVVGMVSILLTVSTAEGGRVAWLEDMIVHPDWRGSGIGEMLLRQAVTAARDVGCKRITLLTDEGNDAAMRYDSRGGFVRSGMIPFRLKL